MALGHKMDEIAEEKLSKEKWIKTRMWITTLASRFKPDLGMTFKGLGNKMFIGNNQYATENGLTSLILVEELSEKVPYAVTGKIMKEIKSELPGTIVDFTYKINDYKPDLGTGLNSRRKSWNATVVNPVVPRKRKEMAQRALFSADEMESGVKAWRIRLYIHLRSSSGLKLQSAIKQVSKILNKYDVDFKPIKSDLETNLKYVSIANSKVDQKLKDIGYTVMNFETIAKTLPVIQGMNDETGSYLGINRGNMRGYYIDFRKNSGGKNILIIAKTGDGKSFMISFWIFDFYAIKYNILIYDVKGIDYNGICSMLDSATINLGPKSKKFVNTFYMDRDGIRVNQSPQEYYNTNLKNSKEVIRILCGISEEDVSGLNIIEDFLRKLYSVIGTTQDNPNTWARTSELSPNTIYEYFKSYCSVSMRKAYGQKIIDMLDSLRTYFSIDGSEHIAFSEPYTKEEIQGRQIVRISFDMLDGSEVKDIKLLKVKYFFAGLISDEYVQANNNRKEWTLVIEEEAQVAKDYLMDRYVKYNTLWRALNVVTVMSCNSYSTLKTNPQAVAILDNVNAVLIGTISKSVRDEMIEDFELENDEANHIKNINSTDPRMQHCFLMVNKMGRGKKSAVIKAYVPLEVSEADEMKTVDTTTTK